MPASSTADALSFAQRLVFGLLASRGSGSGALAQGDQSPGRASRRPRCAGNKVELTLRLSDTAPTPLTFTVDNPARIALDLPDTTVAMASRRVDVKQGALDTVNVAEANGRTRVVLNVDSLVPYETRVQGNTIVVTLGGGGARAPASALRLLDRAWRPPRRAPAAAPVSGARSVSNIDFRRGADGSGRIIVELTDAKVPADLRQEGGRIVVNFAKTTLPETLMQRLDVTDFATPVNTVDALRVGDGARLVIAATRRLRAARLPVRQHLHDRNQAGREAAARAAGPEGIHRRAPDPELPGHRDARRAAAAGGYQRPEHGHQRHGRRQRHAAPAERAVGPGARRRDAHQGPRHAPAKAT